MKISDLILLLEIKKRQMGDVEIYVSDVSREGGLDFPVLLESTSKSFQIIYNEEENNLKKEEIKPPFLLIV